MFLLRWLNEMKKIFLDFAFDQKEYFRNLWPKDRSVFPPAGGLLLRIFQTEVDSAYSLCRRKASTQLLAVGRALISSRPKDEPSPF